MEANKEEALKAIENAEKRFSQRDFAGAKNYALKAKELCPELEGISQMVSTFDVHIASEFRHNGEVDYYSVLGLKPTADKEAVKRQYKKLAVLLHPDKNKCVGADGAFKLVSEAWTWLDNSMRSSYNLKRKYSSFHAPGYNKCSNLPASRSKLDTFWTICTACKVQYEYLRKYVNKKLSCKNCRGTFVAVETGAAPANGSFPYSPLPYVPGNGYGNHSFDGVTYVPTNAAYFNGNGVTGYHSGHGYDYVSNVSFQLGSTGLIHQNGSATTLPADSVYRVNGNAKRGRPKVKSGANGRPPMAETVVNINSHVLFSCNKPQEVMPDRPYKKRKVTVGASFRNGYDAKGSKCALEAVVSKGNDNIGTGQKVVVKNEVQTKHCFMPPAFDARKLLIEKARTVIRKKLEEIKLSSEAATLKEKEKAQVDVCQVKRETCRKASLNVPGLQLEPHGKAGPISITVPDSDFHDFDKDRTEECFKPKQIWALYDEEDGMPRLYCLIREVISVNPFRIHISYLSSKTDSEFGSVNWLESGFTKSCGNFRAWTSDIVDQVNVFSHVLGREKAGRGGCVRIYPRSGDIWAVYRNWSPDWNQSTPDNVRHEYDMVEVLYDYSEDLGVCVTPLIKLSGFKTVYKRNPDQGAEKWIPRREMVRFSHQVPSWLLNGEEANLPDRCFDLDPAATPDGLLHTAAATEAKAL